MQEKKERKSFLVLCSFCVNLKYWLQWKLKHEHKLLKDKSWTLVLPFVGLWDSSWLDCPSLWVILEVFLADLCWFISGGQRCSTMLWLRVLKVVQLCHAERSQCVCKLRIGDSFFFFSPPPPLWYPSERLSVRNRSPYGNNLPPPLTLFRLVSPTNTMATSRGTPVDEWPAHVKSAELTSGAFGLHLRAQTSQK